MKVLAVTGGVGGAKLSLGLARILQPTEVDFLVNTGDDFESFGLTICPDVDTLLYTLSGQSNTETGWGRANETWNCLDALSTLGAETWFQLGDRDLALHLRRTELLAAGHSLTETIGAIAKAFGIPHRIFPMTEDLVRTRVRTADGELDFQSYFVKHKCEPIITGIFFAGIGDAHLNPAVDFRSYDAVVFCPSNPYVSVDPVISLPEFDYFLKNRSAPVVAVSPIVGGTALKGPAAKMMSELSLSASVKTIAEHYANKIDCLVIDDVDAPLAPAIEDLGVHCSVAPTVMHTTEDKELLAQNVLDLTRTLNNS